MGLTGTLYTVLSGLNTNSTMLSVAGNNIANANTTGYKASRIDFQTQISQTLKNASGPTSDSGGSNPIQVGMGVTEAGMVRDFTGGTPQPTGVATDMAIDGNGFFVVSDHGSNRYTRAGDFVTDGNYNLVDTNGNHVQGYGVDDNFNVIPGQLRDIRLPVGVETLAEATDNVEFAGNLNAGGDVATQGSEITSMALFSDAAATIPATGATAMNSLFDAGGNALFTTGDVITLTGATRGGATIPDHTFEINATNTTGSDANGTTLADLTTFLNNALGIDTAVSGGVSVVAGKIDIVGNKGAANDLEVAAKNLIVNMGTSPTTPMDFTKAQAADGESAQTTLAAYDSLGNAMDVNLTLTLIARDSTGTTWGYIAQSQDSAAASPVLGEGTLTFDTNGKLTNVSNDAINIDRSGTGAANLQQITLSFSDGAGGGGLSALADASSQIHVVSQNGAPIGTLDDFNVGADGTVTGTFSNGLSRTLGQIPLATFINPNGLESIGANMFAATVNSGNANLISAASGAAGQIVGRALEQSNVDLSKEFINLIRASTGFSANSRVFTTSDQLLKNLINTIQ